MDLWMKIIVAGALGYMVFRLWPAANQMLKHGPKGSGNDWRAVLLPLGAVVLFVLLLIMLVRG